MLGVKSDKYASMLYPLVESCLPINLLRIWERHLSSIMFKSDEKFSKLETLMKFLGKEIEVEEKINLAKSGFGLDHKTKKNQPMKSSFNRNKNITTGMEFYSSVQDSATSKNSQCVCCDKNHSSAECSYAQNLPVEQRKRADIAGKLLTGGYKLLPSGLVAIETRLGWTVMGLTRREKGDENTGLIITSMSTREISETDLWNLDAIGIKDQAEKQSKMEQEEATRQHFLKTLKRLPEGRYENLLRDYEDVFHEWLKEEIIEPVNISRLDDLCTYLPHRAVIKENLTTKIRPVFDTSAKQKNGSSLNSCLEKGPNLVELIPSILNRFRLGTFGVIADIKKAFLQISIDYKNRDYLRFLWFENGDPDNLMIYRHKRVVFGINASTFLFGATISYHLDNVPEHLQEVAKKLKTSMYIDNCVTSLDTIEEVESFIEQSKE
ncbi:hypothetical protein AVEN_49570-1 [Araneus ventricosus]|uniref:Reverse transcriptase domain-containing protein n=1 Tax=Araneus ventricosus TaxID=182803 RepID=A0A4Y2HZ36_ARAVE|nr:hypothetical protein AVEN_49570-1 [Araneus ventricosus]